MITTCSKENFEYVKGLGADLVVDYKDDSAVAQICSFTNNSLVYAWDTVGVEQSAKFCADVLSIEAGADPVYATILPVKFPRSDVRTVSTVMYTVFGKDFKFGPVDMPASQEDFEFGKSFFGLVEELLQQVCYSINSVSAGCADANVACSHSGSVDTAPSPIGEWGSR